MPRPLPQRRIEKILKQGGFVLQRQAGSHRVWRNEKTGRTAVVPNHGKDIAVGTYLSIIKQSGLDKSLFV